MDSLINIVYFIGVLSAATFVVTGFIAAIIYKITIPSLIRKRRAERKEELCD